MGRPKKKEFLPHEGDIYFFNGNEFEQIQNDGNYFIAELDDLRDFIPYQVGDEQFFIPKSHYIPVEELSHYYLMLKELKADKECLSFFPNFLALANVLYRFPEFKSNIEIFFYHKIITFEKGHFKWNYDKTSLAQYFKSIKKENNETQLFWEYVEYAFSEQKGSLRPLGCDNGSVRKPSKDYMKIIKLVDTKEDKKYMDKITALADMFDEYSDNYFWKDDGTEMEFVEWCEAKFFMIKKIIDNK